MHSSNGEELSLAKPVKVRENQLSDLINELSNQLNKAVISDSIQAVKLLSSASVSEVKDQLSYQAIFFAHDVLFTFDMEEEILSDKANQLKKKLDLRF